MDTIERVKVKVTLKAGDQEWVEGRIVSAPIPDVLLEEVRLQTGTVEVLKEGKSIDNGKLVFRTKRVEEVAGPEKTTLTSASVPNENFLTGIKEPEKAKPIVSRPILKRRKKK